MPVRNVVISSAGLLLLAMKLNVALPASELRNPEDVLESYVKLRQQGREAEVPREAGVIVDEAEKFIRENPESPRVLNATLNIALAYGLRGNKDFFKSEKIFREISEKYPKKELIPEVKLRYADLFAFGRVGLEDKVGEGRRALLEMMKDYAGSEWEVKAKHTLALSYYHFTWNCWHTDTEAIAIRDIAVRLFEEISDKHPDSASGRAATHKLALHYVDIAPDTDKALKYSLKLLEIGKGANADLYAQVVAKLTKNRGLFLGVAREETARRAEDLIARYPPATSSERKRFVRRLAHWYHMRWIESKLSEIMQYAEKKKKKELLRDTIMLQGICYFCKESSKRCVDYFLKAKDERKELLREQDLRIIQDYFAMSHFWGKDYEKAAGIFHELASTASDPPDDDKDTIRTKPYYVFCEGISLFMGGRFAESKVLFDKVVRSYPETKWAAKSSEYVGYLGPLLKTLALSGEEK